MVGGAAGVGIPGPLLAGSVGGGSVPHGALDLDPAVASQVQADRDLGVHPGHVPRSESAAVHFSEVAVVCFGDVADGTGLRNRIGMTSSTHPAHP